MTDTGPRLPPGRLPTLTEVVRIDEVAAPVPPRSVTPVGALPVVPPAASEPVVEATAPEAVDAAWPEPGSPQAEQLVDEVLDAVQRRIDLLFEYRVREALVPALGRVAELLVQESRDTLADMLREVVGKAVAQELAARRRREP